MLFTPCAKVHITSSARPENNELFEVICELLRVEIQEQNDLWIAYRGDSRTKRSVDCLQRRFKNETICGLLTEEIQAYKVSTLCYQCLNSVAMPSYLCELLQTYKPTRTLRSQDSSLLVVPRFSLNTYGKRSFSVYGPATWNSLPVHVRQSQCLVTFKKQLKTYLFTKHLSE